MHRRIIVILFAVQAALLLAACGSDPAPLAGARAAYVPRTTAEAARVMVPRLHEAVGTVRARTDVSVEAQVTGRVLEVLVRPGDKVADGDRLVVLDGRASQARLDQSLQARQTASSMIAQARDGLASAKAAFDKAESTYRRMQQLGEQRVVTAEEVEQAESAYLQARAAVGQAEEGVAAAQARSREGDKVIREAEIDLEHTAILARETGEVAKRLVEPGDLAFPGKKLLVLQTGASLRLEAMVREGLIGRVRVGDRVEVIVSALGEGEPLEAVVDEMEPLADPVTRSFLVKARLPEAPGLYPGMFGRLLVPLGEREAVLVPQAALIRVGQLETVMVRQGDAWQPVHVRTGERVGEGEGEMIEVLSGLSGGETVGVGAGVVQASGVGEDG
ncbi:MAG: efflux RND transporter periplasmic adaptor subunit [Pseudodesulfovibrio sp.]|uniref:Efflux transporter, RND family, MFP subunit n=1 Tax=Pseudodesulfovibrio aespoeensis (strain ATCC 700646 / DSM 10631 / Aspo-2) TaxID=643562 RepID=E6VV48_PSEA9|nr:MULTISPECIES: efflux RND transporter periplasmic adaptor subunit [Pseudodesulfovibrio]MBU4191466.1 efflux RND transporter periplasmic adaptor subunit [Pseudomonadota bacterium]ADU61199.1 efflux transporter, RND family, MFP subunit [Pseudodesulfovibrio aespoeensis Aspo-2]MBU4245281.1 efflux RND transporter periplasmic adaptor subunit [Pseudomonadota bacterium]MBU4379237.1 efflux RND transporter periplasmic adaptor subunit [Pseudomonadota bacterium]MBU4476649.1 efflux RND transporter periplas